MSHTLTLQDRRLSSGELQSVNDIPPKMTDWWADFGVSERTVTAAKTNPFQRVETSGLFFLQEVAEDLKQRPRPMAHVEAPKPPHVLMTPPPVLPMESSLVAPRHSVWAIPGVLGGMVFVALLSILGTLWLTDRTGTPSGSKGWSSSAAAVTGAGNARDTLSKPAVTPALRRARPTSLATTAPAPMVPPPTRPAVAPSAPVDSPDMATTADPEHARDRKRRRSKRSGRSRDRDEEEEAPAPAAPGYSLYATLNSAGSAPSPASARKPVAVVAEAAPVAQPAPRPGATFRMLQVAAAGERKPIARPSLPTQLPRAAVTRALAQVRSPIQACLRRFGFGHATIRLRLTITGATGRVSGARAMGRFRDTPVGRCAQRRVRNLRFGRFARTSQTILLPIRAL